MTLETKFQVGDAVYILDGFTIIKAPVIEVAAIVNQEKQVNMYRFQNFDARTEDEVFSSREDLFNHIK